MTFSTAGVFSQNLLKFIEFYEDIGDLDPDNLKQGELKSEVMYKDDKKYHMDLKENARGRFLKVNSQSYKKNIKRIVIVSRCQRHSRVDTRGSRFSSRRMEWETSSRISESS